MFLSLNRYDSKVVSYCANVCIYANNMYIGTFFFVCLCFQQGFLFVCFCYFFFFYIFGVVKGILYQDFLLNKTASDKLIWGALTWTRALEHSLGTTDFVKLSVVTMLTIRIEQFHFLHCSSLESCIRSMFHILELHSKEFYPFPCACWDLIADCHEGSVGTLWTRRRTQRMVLE